MLPRIIIVAHGHPSISKGGAEIAAYNFFKEFKQHGAECLFVARSDESSHGGSAFSVVGDGELLFHTRMSDFFLFRSAEPSHITHNFRQLLESFKPDVVHFHHYVHLGLEMILEVRRTCPNAKVFVTLHEFLAICHHNGQMVKTGTFNLCYRASPKDCANCFKSYSPGDFFLRERYIKAIFEAVTAFIAPSNFLKSRYVEWGLPEDKSTLSKTGSRKSISFRHDPWPKARHEDDSPISGKSILIRESISSLRPSSCCQKACATRSISTSMALIWKSRNLNFKRKFDSFWKSLGIVSLGTVLTRPTRCLDCWQISTGSSFHLFGGKTLHW